MSHELGKCGKIDAFLLNAITSMKVGNWKGGMFWLGKAEQAATIYLDGDLLVRKLTLIDSLVTDCYSERKPT